MKNETKAIYEVVYNGYDEMFAYFDSEEEARCFAQTTVNKEWLSSKTEAYLTGYEVTIPYYYSYSTAEQLVADLKINKVKVDEWDDELGFSSYNITIMEKVVKE